MSKDIEMEILRPRCDRHRSRHRRHLLIKFSTVSKKFPPFLVFLSPVERGPKFFKKLGFPNRRTVRIEQSPLSRKGSPTESRSLRSLRLFSIGPRRPIYVFFKWRLRNSPINKETRARCKLGSIKWLPERTIRSFGVSEPRKHVLSPIRRILPKPRP